MALSISARQVAFLSAIAVAVRLDENGLEIFPDSYRAKPARPASGMKKNKRKRNRARFDPCFFLRPGVGGSYMDELPEVILSPFWIVTLFAFSNREVSCKPQLIPCGPIG